METKATSPTAKIAFGVLSGATVGMALYLWVSPYIGGRCLVVCNPYRSVIAGTLIGGAVAALLDASARRRRRLSQQPGGRRILKRGQQKRALWVGATIFALITLFPPWTVTRLSEKGDMQLTRAHRYRLLWHPPSVKKDREGTSVDVERLLIQWVLVAVITGVAIAAARMDGEEPRTP